MPCEQGRPSMEALSISGAESGRGGYLTYLLSTIWSSFLAEKIPVVGRTTGRGKSRHILEVIPQCRELRTLQLFGELRAGAFRARPRELGLFLCLLWLLVQALCRPSPNKTTGEENLAILVHLNSHQAFCLPPWLPLSLCWDSCLAGLTGRSAKRAAPINGAVISSSVLKSHTLPN